MACVGCPGPTRFKKLSLWDQFRNFFEAMRRLAGASKKLVSEPVLRQRYDTCVNCPGKHLEHSRCMLCGCFVKFKAVLATEQCPGGYWPV